MEPIVAERSALDFLTRALDQPAREALLVSRSGLFGVALRAALGACAVLASGTLAGLLAPDPALGERGLLALGIALVAVTPALVAVAIERKLRLSPSALLAVLSMAALVAGVASLALLPLAAFVRLVARASPAILSAFPLLVALTALAAFALVPGRVIRSLDPSLGATAVTNAYSVVLTAVFAYQAWPAFHAVLGLSR